MAASTDYGRTLNLSELRCAAGTDVGMRRDENQDSFGIITKPTVHGFFVADGMGGVNGGAVASRLAIATLEAVLTEEDAKSPERTRAVVQIVNEKIFEKGSSEAGFAGMGTTLVGLLFTPLETLLVNVGDSRAYRVRGEQILQLSEDHTLVRELLKSGAISEEQAENHPVSHMLTRSLGPLQEVQVDCTPLIEFPEIGDVYVLCSDGLYNFVDESEILHVVKQNPLDDANQILINLANQRGGADNITVLVISVGESHNLGRSAAYRKARDNSATEDPIDPQVVLQSVAGILKKDESSEHSLDPQETKKLQQESVTDLGSPIVQEPVESGKKRRIDRLRPATPKEQSELDPQPQSALKKNKKSGTERTSWRWFRMIPVPFLVMMALVLGLIVGSVAKKAVSDFLGDSSSSDSSTEIALDNSNSSVLSKNDRAISTEYDGGAESSSTSTEFDIGATLARVQSNLERVKRTRAVFNEALTKVETQISSFDSANKAQIDQTLQEARVQADELQGKISDTELQIDASSRKLSQWYVRQKRLESVDPLKLAAEVGATSDSVQSKKTSFEQATYEFIKKRDEFELYPSNNSLGDQVSSLKERRAVLLKELQDDVKRTVERVLSETDKQLEELKDQRDMLNIQLQSIKQDLEVAKSLAESEPEQRTKTKQRLEAKRQGLRTSLAELDAILAKGNKPAGQQSESKPQ